MPAERRLGKTALLRLSFASVEQLRAHLRFEDKATLLFFRDAELDLAAGTTAMIEMVFDNSEQTRVVRASVARSSGGVLWLAVPDARFAREVTERALVGRRGRRLGVDRLLRLERESGAESMVTLLDISLAGGRIGGGLPPQLSVGDRVALELASIEVGETPGIGTARVAWIDAGEAGILFERTEPARRAAVAKLFEACEFRWRSAREIRHPDTCCHGAEPLRATSSCC